MLHRQTCGPYGCVDAVPKDRWTCKWEQQQKLQASDRRPGDRFGTSVAVDDETGTAVVGAPFSRAVDHFNRNLRTTMDGVVNPNGGFQAEAGGALYVFSRTEERRDGLGGLVEEPHWPATERAKLQPAQLGAADLFGRSVALDGSQAVGGAPREPVEVYRGGRGTVTLMDVGFQELSFTKKEYVVNEFNANDDPGGVELVVERSGSLATTLHVNYATSDVTAIGISQGESVVCLAQVPANRGECGDYIMNSGTLTFLPGQTSQNIKVLIIDDYCREHFMEYFKVSLMVPGGGPILGEAYQAVVRIDDNVGSRTVNAADCNRVAAADV